MASIYWIAPNPIKGLESVSALPPFLLEGPPSESAGDQMKSWG